MVKLEHKQRGRPAIGRNNKSLTLTISKELHDKVKDYAATKERSISFVTKKALELFLDSKNKEL